MKKTYRKTCRRVASFVSAMWLAIVMTIMPAIEAAAAPPPTPTRNVATADLMQAMFSAEFYAAMNPDVAKAYGKDTKGMFNHFRTFGMKEGRKNLSPALDWAAYKAANPDLAKAFGDNVKAYFEHFATYGIYEMANGQRSMKGAKVNLLAYAKAYPDVAQFCGNDLLAILKHYCNHGYAEGRTKGTTYEKPQPVQRSQDANPGSGGGGGGGSGSGSGGGSGSGSGGGSGSGSGSSGGSGESGSGSGESGGSGGGGSTGGGSEEKPGDDEKLPEMKPGEDVVVLSSSADDTTTATVSAKAYQALVANNVAAVVMTSDVGSIRVPIEALAMAGGENYTPVTIVAKKLGSVPGVANGIVTDSAGNSIDAANAVAIDITLQVDGVAQNISGLDEKIQITVANGGIDEGAAADAYYLDKNDKLVLIDQATVTDKKIIFGTPHLTTFVILARKHTLTLREHTYGMFTTDGKCGWCDETLENWQNQHEHEFNLDGTGECKVCHKTNACEVKHETTDASGKCKTCGAELTHVHSEGVWVKTDTAEHWKECPVCHEELTTKEEHKLGDWEVKVEPTETKEGSEERSCETCTYKETRAIPKITHEASGAWKSDATGHWQKCVKPGHSSDEKLVFAEHTFKNGVCECGWDCKHTTWDAKSGKCAACGETHGHEKWTDGVCDGCGFKCPADHDPVAKLNATCGTCGKDLDHEHTAEATYQHNASGHWKNCVAGDQEYWIAKTAHTFGAWKVTKEPTEDAEGSKEQKCFCGEVKTEAIAKVAHVHDTSGDWESDASEHWKVCAKDNEKVGVTAHTTWENGKCETCGYGCGHSAGYKDGKCNTCGQDHPHDLSMMFVTQTCSCGLKGTKAITECSVYKTTGHKVTTLVTDADKCRECETQLIHEHTEKSTWTTDETQHWKECQYDSDVVVARADHTFGDWEVKQEPTEDAAGKKEQVCSVCGAVKSETLARLDHQAASDWTTDDNDHWKACVSHNKVVVGEKEAHKFGDWKVTKQPTEAEFGREERVCSVCELKVARDIDKIVHTPAATWSSDETNHWYKCTQTGHDDKLQIAAHTLDPNGTKKDGSCEVCGRPGVCDHAGVSPGDTCGKCGKLIPIIHKATSEHVKANFDSTTGLCTVDSVNCQLTKTQWQGQHGAHAWTNGVCTICDLACAHDFDAWVTITPATETQVGSAERVCKTCTLKETKELPMITHAAADVWSKDDTEHWKACTVEGHTDKLEVATHNFGTWTTTKPATETEAGEKTQTCVCGATNTETIPQLAHVNHYTPYGGTVCLICKVDFAAGTGGSYVDGKTAQNSEAATLKTASEETNIAAQSEEATTEAESEDETEDEASEEPLQALPEIKDDIQKPDPIVAEEVAPTNQVVPLA